MNKFIITDIKTIVESSPFSTGMIASVENPYESSYQTYQSYEITLRPQRPSEETAKKLANIIQAGKVVELNSTEYADFVKPYKREFIEFMEKNYPEKLLKDPKAWEAINSI
jgi:hypothetical protein